MNILNYQPLEQFEIIYLGYLGGLPITNSLVYLIVVYLLIRFLFGVVFLKKTIIPHNFQNFVELIYNFVFSLIKQQIGVRGYVYFPIILSLFMFVLVANVIGMTLYSFTLTSHVTVALP